MRNTYCQSCGYDLTGLVGKGACPECGNMYDADAPFRQNYRPDHPISRYMAAIGMATLTLTILVCGGLLSLASSEPTGLIVTTVLIALVTGFGTFTYWWTARHEGRGRD